MAWFEALTSLIGIKKFISLRNKGFKIKIIASKYAVKCCRSTTVYCRRGGRRSVNHRLHFPKVDQYFYSKIYRFGLDPGNSIGLEGCTTTDTYSSLEDFFKECGVYEVETLNAYATSGCCQFSALGEQMYF